MKSFIKKSFIICLILILALTCGCAEAKTSSEKLKLNRKSMTLKVKQSKTLKLKNATKKVTFKITSGKSLIKLKRKSKTSVTVTGLKKGTAKIKAAIGKQSYTCAVTVRAKSANNIKLKINGKIFTAKLNNGSAAKKLKSMLPFTITMNELNGNEKYHYFDTEFSGEEKTFKTINAGDLMIYGGDCLVLFYDKIENSPFSYIKVGTLSSIDGLKSVLGSGNVKVKFKK